MNPFVTVKDIDQAAQFITNKISVAPQVALVLGSGLGGLADEVTNPVVIPYADIPNWPVSTIHGHVGRLVIGALAGVQVMVMQGRAHYYEGYAMDHVTLPIRVMQRMKIGTIILTNAAGAINPDYQPGDVMALNDHIGLIGMAGLNPLRGPNLDEFGERFPDMSQVYDRELIKKSATIAKENNIQLHQGVYVCLSGPSFESPADLRFLRGIGADAVGMSTVPEAIVARHGRTRVLAFSGISNKANLDGNTETTHEEVLAAGSMIVPKLTTLIKGVLNSISGK
ncbi:MAG: purine-nucleoside phosphorylase [Chloroflexi bacterium HGW-Chloroflexi-4]|jgi:purine-nucleoside phosphorylase|nr:MAG: purine-nucleoside phosphorylase [Chloroflexi bacterium HGW-Chloroflexi-4]